MKPLYLVTITFVSGVKKELACSEIKHNRFDMEFILIDASSKTWLPHQIRSVKVKVISK